MDERRLTTLVQAYADELGLLVHHCPDSRRCEGNRGLPDLIIVSFRGVLFAELKDEYGETSADQDLWLYNLHKVKEQAYASGSVPVRYAIWRPSDWAVGAIQASLRQMAVPGS